MSRSESGNPSNQSTASQVKDKVQEVASNVRDMGSQAYETASQKYEDAKESAAEYYRAGRDRAMEWESQIESYVRERPIKSLLMAAGVGIVIGMIWKRI